MPNISIKSPRHRVKQLSLIAIFLLTCILPLTLGVKVILATSLTDDTTITATVPDNSGPTTPVLVSPGNGSYVTDSTPDFTWEESTDDNGVGHYQLSLDGSPLYDGIPTTSTDNSYYTLVYNSTTQKYTLTPKSTINDGDHTWKIRAVDNLGNGTNSATWSFTMDTLAPSYVITNFGELSTSISAKDTGTIPSSPLELDNNEPLLSGTGEASSAVTVILTIPSDPTQNFSYSISSGGTWSLQLGILPRDVVMTLDFTITDPAGNVSVLTGLDFIINSPVIVFPPTPTPTPTTTASPTPSPTSTAIPGVTTPTPSPTPTLPTPTPAEPLIEIPYTPPREVIFELAQETIERIPEPIKRIAQAVPKQIVQTVESSTPYSGALVSAAIPVASAVAVGSQFGGGLSFSIIIKILQALGLIPSGKPQGLVFDSDTYEPVPFALLTITNKNSQKTPVKETVVTDVFGVYRGVKLDPDQYEIEVSHQDFKFPTTKKRPQYISLQDYYKGETFKVVSSIVEQLFLIPVDAIKQARGKAFKSQLRIKLAQLSKFSNKVLIPLFFLSGFLAIAFPSTWNTIVVGLYGLALAYRSIAWFRVPLITGIVSDESGAPVQNAVVRLSISQTNQLSAVISTDEKGEFKYFGPKAKYELVVTKPGYLWVQENGSISFHEINATAGSQTASAVLQPASKFYSDLLS